VIRASSETAPKSRQPSKTPGSLSILARSFAELVLGYRVVGRPRPGPGQWRAQLSGGVPAALIPEGVRPAAAMLQAAHDGLPRRLTPLQEALSNSGELTYHRLGPSSPDES
jgi:hypothetical protein